MNKIIFLIIVITVLTIGAKKGENEDKAQIYYEKAMDMYSSELQGFYIPEKSINYLSIAIDNYGREPIFYAERSLAYLQMENKEKAIKDINKAISMDPFIDFYITRFFIYCNTHDRVMAESEAEFLCEIKKDCFFKEKLMDKNVCSKYDDFELNSGDKARAIEIADSEDYC